MNTSEPSTHRWRFSHTGGFDQVKLQTGADLCHLDQLDQKLWVALACPVLGLEFDSTTANFVDTDKDGRIRAAELIAAVKWAESSLKDPEILVARRKSLPLSAINDAAPNGRQIVASARQILANLGKNDSTEITAEDASAAGKVFASMPFNGDGVILAEAGGGEIQSVITDMITCLGSVVDRSGKPGIDLQKMETFFTECHAFDAWISESEASSGAVFPAGEATALASASIKTARTKVDDYFGRCRLAAYDPRTVALLNRKEEDYVALAGRDISFTVSEAASFPLALIAPGKPLPLKSGINPAHAAVVADLYLHAVVPLLGERTELTEEEWVRMQARLNPFETWSAAKAGASVEKLGIQRVRQILAGAAKEEIARLIQKDLAQEPEAASIAGVEKLCRFVRDLHLLCLNFVNFRDLYEGKDQAIFQCGTLFLDQRACHLCLRVEDPARHVAMAGMAGAYLAYCDCVRKGPGEKMHIVAVFSQGTDDNLMVGRNGLFYDRKGLDYDATITRIVSNPISLRQAFWLPYKKLVRMVEEQIAKRAAAAEAASDAKLAGAAAVTTQPDKIKPAGSGKVDIGTVAAMGVALGAIGTAISYFLGLFKDLPSWKVPLIFLALIALISGPSLILAFVKLRKRNLGPLLDANGWAVNARARISVPFGTSLTEIARLPKGSTVDLSDRYSEKFPAGPRLLLYVFLVWWIYAFISDTGILYRLTKDWQLPLGKPPASITTIPRKA